MRIALVAGEVSGDQLGAPLIDALKRRWPHAEFVGIGGPRMQAAGLTSWFPMEALSVMGLVEVLKHLPRLLLLRRELIARLSAWRPDLYIGIDAPDFNLGVEKRLRAGGVATVHYVSPSVWAWREKRAPRIGESARLVLCLFPMEPAIYQRYGVAAEFVGHPATRRFPAERDTRAAKARLGLDPQRPLLAVLPGSRGSEIARIGPPFIVAARAFIAAHPQFHALAPMANARCAAAFAALDPTPITQLDGRADDVLMAADLALVASGTAALEALLAQVPMVVGYRVAPLTHMLVRSLRLLKTDRFSLPNILSDRDTVPEHMQTALTAENLRGSLDHWQRDFGARQMYAERAQQVRAALDRESSELAAAIARVLQ
jgi:lipid-A-disaccharide synthase